MLDKLDKLEKNNVFEEFSGAPLTGAWIRGPLDLLAGQGGPLTRGPKVLQPKSGPVH